MYMALVSICWPKCILNRIDARNISCQRFHLRAILLKFCIPKVSSIYSKSQAMPFDNQCIRHLGLLGMGLLGCFWAAVESD